MNRKTMLPEVSAATLCTDALCPRKILKALIFAGEFSGSSVSNYQEKGNALSHGTTRLL